MSEHKEQERHCSTCKFHLHITGGAHLQYCSKLPDANGEPQPCVAARPKCDGKYWEISSAA